MRTLYIECGMGAAGDMLTAALLELLPDSAAFLERLRSTLPEGVDVQANRTVQQGITGTQMTVTVNGEEEHSHDVHGHHRHEHDDGVQEHEHHHTHRHEHHHHASMAEIEALIGGAQVSEAVREKAVTVYRLIAEAESHAHGKPVHEIHFHEVGTKDAIADVLAVCMLMEEIAPERVIVSPVHVGSGHVHCAHGILPVPAPATAYILRNIPIYGGSIEGELCTPTGAALLRTFADSFGEMPVMQTEAVGYGFGRKAFPRLNCVRAFLGETGEQPGQIAELCCNLDDMTGEAIGFAQEVLLQGGALDVYTTPVMMKKGRPGVLLTVLCRPEERGQMLELLFRYTLTAGVRERSCMRYALHRTESAAETSAGTVRVKRVSGFGTERSKPEYDDLKPIAEARQECIDTVRSEIGNELK